MRKKITLALGAIAVLLITVIVISGWEFSHMSSVVSDSISEDIATINISQKIASETERFNLQILETIGDSDSLAAVTNFNLPVAIAGVEEVFGELAGAPQTPLTDSLTLVFEEYITEARKLESVVSSDYLSSKNWYFDELQPYYNNFTATLVSYNEAIHRDLMLKADEFDAGYYRSLTPSFVTMLAGILLLIMLLFYLLTYYIKPLRHMLSGIEEYTQRGRRYTYDFEGDDELKKLNEGISTIVEENVILRKRIKSIKEKDGAE